MTVICTLVLETWAEEGEGGEEREEEGEGSKEREEEGGE